MCVCTSVCIIIIRTHNIYLHLCICCIDDYRCYSYNQKKSKQIWCMHITIYGIIWLHVGFCHVYSFTMHIVCHLQVCFETWLVLFSSPHGSSKYCSCFFLRAIHIPTGSQWKRTPSFVRWICWFLLASTVFYEARSQHTWHTPCAPQRHPDETVKGEEFMSSESLLGKWVDSQA